MLKRAGVALLLIILWTTGVVAGALFGWWRRAIAPADDPRAFLQAATRRINTSHRGNSALVLIENGAVAAEFYSANAEPIDANTIFATASLSKWIAAHAVMKLVEQGKLDLDKPVDTYLTRWHLPASAFSTQEVTARRLLSHTAGLTDALGFGDYRRDEPLPTLEEALSAPRSTTGAPSPISVGIAPGSQFKYSGGGYLLLELLVEEIAGESFESFVTREIFNPLGMTRSGYADLSTMTNSAMSYDANGRPAPTYRYASKAATGFSTSAGDLVKFVLAHLRDLPGSPLAQTTLASMRVAEAKSMGVDLWGLGTVLYAPTGKGDVVFGHDGVNDPAISATVRLNPDTRDAIIVLATGSKTLASQLGAEWVFWQTGLPDVLTIPAEVRSTWLVLGFGVCGILLLVFVPAWRKARARLAASVLLAAACAQDQSNAEQIVCDPAPEANRARVLAFYRDALLNRSPRAAFVKFMAPDFVEHKPDIATGTRDSTAAFLERLMQELPEARWQVHRSLADGDMVVVHASFTPAPGAPAYAIADLFRLQQCKIVEHCDVVGQPADHPLNPHPRF